MSKLLLDEHPIVILPGLACQVGLNEAIILQKIHYWVNQNESAGRNKKNGFTWTFNTYKEWQQQLPFFSYMTIRRTITNLERQGILVTANHNKKAYDKTKWYRIDYSKLDVPSCVQNEQSMCSD